MLQGWGGAGSAGCSAAVTVGIPGHVRVATQTIMARPVRFRITLSRYVVFGGFVHWTTEFCGSRWCPVAGQQSDALTSQVVLVTAAHPKWALVAPWHGNVRGSGPVTRFNQSIGGPSQS